MRKLIPAYHIRVAIQGQDKLDMLMRASVVVAAIGRPFMAA